MALVSKEDFASALKIPYGTIRSRVSRKQLCCNRIGFIDTENPKNYSYILTINGGDQSVFDDYHQGVVSKSKVVKKTTLLNKSVKNISNVEKKVIPPEKTEIISKNSKNNNVSNNKGSVNIAPSQNKTKKCIECGNEFGGFMVHGTSRYCSNKCRGEKRIRTNLANKDKRKDRINSGDIDFIANEIYIKYKQRSPSRGLDFNLTLDFFKKYVHSDCFYCGNVIPKVGFDRKDNSIGYVEENCVPCCPDCNFMKKDLSFEDFIEKCKSISKNFSDEESVIIKKPIKDSNEQKLTLEEKKEKESERKARESFLHIEIRKKLADVLVVERNAELKQYELEKKAGNTLPLDMIEKVIAVNYKAVFKSIHSQIKNIAMVMVQQLGGSKEDLNSILIEMENLLDTTVKDSKKKAKVDINKLIEEYSEVRSRGERKI